MQASDLVTAQLSKAPASGAQGVPADGDGTPFPELMQSSIGAGTGDMMAADAGSEGGKNLPLAAADADVPLPVDGDSSIVTADDGDELVADPTLTPDPALAALMLRFSSDPHRPAPTPPAADARVAAGPGSASAGITSGVVEVAAVAQTGIESVPTDPLSRMTASVVPADPESPGAGSAPIARADAGQARPEAPSASAAGVVRIEAPDPAVQAAGIAAAAAATRDERDALELKLEVGGVRAGTAAIAAPAANPSAATSASAASYQAVVHAGSASSVALWDHAIGQQLMGMIERGQQHARLQLHPAELGQIDIRLNLAPDRVDLNFTVQQPAVAQALQHSMQQLAQMFSDHGLSLGQAHVAQQDAGRDGSGQQARAGGAQPEGEPPADAGESRLHLRIAPRGLVDAFV